MKEFLRILEENLSKGQIIVIITVVAVEGSAPQRIGAKMLVSNDADRLWGTIGGGSIEKLALEQAKKQIKEKKSLLKKYELIEEGEDSTGMLCGGNMTLFFDVVGSTEKIYIFGAGHISQELIPILKSLGFWIIVIDDREEYINQIILKKEAAESICMDFLEFIDTTEFEPKSYVTILTYSHDLDEKILHHLLTKKKHNIEELQYLGMIGSKRKVKEILDRLISKGVEISQLETIHAPIGLDIGSQTPKEIAISIAAEIIKIRNDERENYV